MTLVTSSTNKYAQTSEPIYITVIGERGSSQRFTLDGKTDPNRGLVDWFIMESERDFGEPQTVVVEIEGTDGWLMEKMSLTFIQAVSRPEYSVVNGNNRWVDDKIDGPTAVWGVEKKGRENNWYGMVLS